MAAGAASNATGAPAVRAFFRAAIERPRTASIPPRPITAASTPQTTPRPGPPARPPTAPENMAHAARFGCTANSRTDFKFEQTGIVRLRFILFRVIVAEKVVVRIVGDVLQRFV